MRAAIKHETWHLKKNRIWIVEKHHEINNIDPAGFKSYFCLMAYREYNLERAL